jgi:TolA-binding protein
MSSSVNLAGLQSVASLLGLNFLPKANSQSDMQAGYNLLVKGDYQSAARILTRTVEEQPESAAARCYLGQALFKSGQYARAAEQFEAAGFIHPLQPVDLMALADAYMAAGNANKAATVYRQISQKNSH